MIRETAQIVNDEMFVLCTELASGSVGIAALELNTWRWTTFTPRGAATTGRMYGSSSWVYKEKIHYFGGPATNI